MLNFSYPVTSSLSFSACNPLISSHIHYWVEFLSKKSDAFPRLMKWKIWAKCETDLKLQYLKSDGGKEFRSGVFEEWLAADGVIHKKSALYKHKQNGIAKGAYRMSPREHCANYSVWICLRASGCMPSRPQSTSSTTAQTQHSLT